MALMLHCGAQEVVFDQLRQLDTPLPTPSHVPIPHFRLVDMLRHSLSYYGHEVVDEHHGVSEDGMRYFGVLSLKSSYGGYEDTVALRNSHDKTFPVGIGFGGRVFCCDNLSFFADHVIRRKHTANAKRDLPGLVQDVVEPLADQRASQQRTFERYRAAELSNPMADHAILEMYRAGIITVQRIAEVVHEWESPSFDELKDRRTAWRLFNAATYVLTGRVVANPAATKQLHTIIDGACASVH
ncbi:conserved hypothetical protein [Candidatus Defluviicoccus seviourii]|uniref:DUF932 domain-containing protein n=1 Tax=Candidatus Defluviicoccus seviourii TaxID=2565273 RepID=A0A564WDQ7_9PROT|nr:conserved hypothetical protein [Candidatus Defluviicoccus seviourii]